VASYTRWTCNGVNVSARALFSAWGTAGTEDVLVNVASQFGDQADFSLSEEVGLVGFSGCLPVWPEWVAQIFEQQGRSASQPAFRSTTREVSYRFRINGSYQAVAGPPT